ncbi:MAG TPA: PEP-CTERM sorting domain-containing protein [Lacipirellulaceae bacterium]|nr:PEP-CTERM sorting domain-containing protein [Lacipirellulaceae bacterium]
MFIRYMAIVQSQNVRGGRLGIAAVLLAAIVFASPRGNCFGQTFWTDGTGSWFNPSNWSLGVPDAGSGTAFDAVIENGGTVQLLATGGSVRRLRVGRTAGTGNLVVDDGTLTVTQDLYLNEGVAGVSSATIQNGGTVTSPITNIAQTGAGTSNFTVTGNNSSLTSGSLTVGNGGTGVLNIQNNGLVYVTSAMSINGTSTVNLNGGTLRFDTITGPNRIVYTAGTIQLAGNRDFSTDTTVAALFPSSTISSGKKLFVEGTGTIQIATELVDGGEFDTQGDLNVGASFAGYLKVLNGGKVVATGNGSIGSSTHGINLVSGAGSNWSVGGNLTIGSGDLTITNQGILYVGGAVNFSTGVASDEINLNGGTLRFNTYSNTSRLEYTAGTIQMAGDRTIGADAAISGIFGSQPTIPNAKQLTVEGTATIAASSQLTLAGGTLSAGAIVVSSASHVVSTQPSQLIGPTLALAGSSIDSTAADLTLGDSTRVNGFYSNGTTNVGSHTVTLADANDAVFDSAALVNLGAAASPGTINSANGLTLDFGGNITGFGLVNTPNSLAKPLINNGHVAGTSVAQPITLNGYVKGVGTFDNVNFTGTFSPGLSPTILSVGNAALSPTSTIIMELGGTSPGSGHDQLVSSGTLSFDGTLQVVLMNGFMPSAGQSFDLFDWVSASGTFDTLALPTLAGLEWDTSQLYTAGVISVGIAGIPGDYNLDGHVDAADYVLFRKYAGTTTALANDPIGGTIGQAQYDQWRSHFGQVAGSGAGPITNAAIPEPATLMLMMLAVSGWYFCHGRSPHGVLSTRQRVKLTESPRPWVRRRILARAPLAAALPPAECATRNLCDGLQER